MNVNFIVAIRAAEERTENFCTELVREQAAGADVAIIRKKPFKKALEECFKAGIKSSKKWLITVDADMLLLPGTIELLLREADKMPKNYLQLQGKIIDKITDNVRKAGPRIYRVSFLPELLKLSESYGDHIRPESRLITKLGDEGYPSRYINVVTCLHDYEQYYRDIYRKSYVHANKHSEFLPKMIETAAAKQHDDLDYKVVLKALWDGLNNNKEVSIDSGKYIELANNALSDLKLEEKKSFNNELSITDIIKPVDTLIPKNISEKLDLIYHDQPKQNSLSLNRFRDSFRRKGLYQSAKGAVGSAFINIGEKIRG